MRARFAGPGTVAAELLVNQGVATSGIFSRSGKPFIVPTSCVPNPLRPGASIVLTAKPALVRSIAVATCLACAGAPAIAATPVQIEGVDGDTRRELRRLLPDRERPDSLLAAERLAEEAADAIRAWLRSEGWYSGAVETIAQENPPAAAVRVTLGPRYRFTQPSLRFGEGLTLPPEADRAARMALRPVRAGEPGRAAVVLAAEVAAVEALRGQGYPEAAALPRRAVVDHAAQTLALEFALAPGARARLGDLVVEPPDLVRENVTARLKTWTDGDFFAPETLNTLRGDLSGTGVFSAATVTLEPTADESGTRDVRVALTPGEPRSVTFGAAYSSLEGIGVDTSFSIRNRMRRMETTTFTASLAEFERRLGADLRLPHALGPGRARTYSIEYAEENIDPFDRSGLRIATSVDARRRQGFAISYGLSLAADMFEASSGEQSALTAAAFGEVRADSTDTPLDARNGGFLNVRLEPGYATGDADVAFLRAIGEVRRYYTPTADDGRQGRFTLAGRAKAGWVSTLTGAEEDLPLDRRFYSGGGGSVRGYAFNSIFPNRERPLAQPPGGQGLVEFGLETRLRVLDRWSIAAFTDAGSAFDETDDAGDFSYGAGLGVRYDLGFAPLRVDVAAPLNPRDDDQPFAIYVSIGQAF